MLPWTENKATTGGTWSVACTKHGCDHRIEIVGAKSGIAEAARFLETELGWRRDARKNRGADRCEWTCVDCKVAQREAAKQPSVGSVHSSFAGGGKK